MGTLAQHLALVSPEAAKSKTPLPWPPDVFAITASLLLQSGAYILLVENWPPADVAESSGREDLSWSERLVETANEWRKGWRDGKTEDRKTPDRVKSWWSTVWSKRDLPMTEVREDDELCSALFHLLAASDEASRGAGLPDRADIEDFFLSRAQTNLVGRKPGPLGSSLCSPSIEPLQARVLPKQHTPQTGITLRSVSHHLALCDLPDVRAKWYMVPSQRALMSTSEETKPVDEPSQSLRLLVVPHPARVEAGQFRPAVPSSGHLNNMPEEYGFFRYEIKEDVKKREEELEHYLREAEKVCDRVDGVVYPELALSAREFAELQDKFVKRGMFLIAGVGEASQGREPGANYVHSNFPIAGGSSNSPLRQDKHHRWCLDRSQIETYGLDGFLSPARRWWEHTRVEPRNLSFMCLNEWLTLCILICEDLARQEPVARVVRAVGPNLVVALLMDGPQLSNRWPAQYATVLADDPGSSVLTLTSVGMAKRSRPPKRPDLPISRMVALWKDTESGSREIELPEGSGALLLTLIPKWKEEWTADGRSDLRSASHPVLAGVHRLPALESNEGKRRRKE